MQEGTVELIAPTTNAQHCTLQQPCIQCTALRTILNSFCYHSKKKTDTQSFQHQKSIRTPLGLWQKAITVSSQATMIAMAAEGNIILNW